MRNPRIWQEWAEEENDPVEAMRAIREQRAADELKASVTQAWKELCNALEAMGVKRR